jgi:hypothetical protein
MQEGVLLEAASAETVLSGICCRKSSFNYYPVCALNTGWSKKIIFSNETLNKSENE